MTGDARRCPDPEVLAAFVAGNLAGPELKMTADHLRHCEDCREIVRMIAHVDREQGDVQSTPRPRRLWPWWLAAAAAALAGTAYLSLWRLRDTTPGTIQILVAAAPRDARALEPRISGGFPWAPLRVVRRAGTEVLDPGQMKLIGAAGEVLEQTANDRSADARHAAAVAHLVAGRPGEAVQSLEALSKSANDAQIWSDLSAALYTLAISSDDPSRLANALAAADKALQLEPQLAEARFNRALVVTRLGLRAQARVAWQHYLELDSSSPWAEEARRRLGELAPRADFREELNRDYERLTRDPAFARTLASRYPQEARVWGETEILARWGEATAARQNAAADGHLRVAKAFAEQLARSSGEGMLRAAVAAIERAGAPNRELLAQAHVRFRDAQQAYQKGRVAEAERLFVNAARDFERGGSPLPVVARYFAANTAFDQGRIAEARQQLEMLLTSRPEFSAHRAQVQWQLGLAYASAGKWGEAIRALDESMATFERLGERKYATAVRELLAEVYDRIGDPHTAWQHRVVALQELGQVENSRLVGAVDAIASAAAMDREWPVCVSFLGLEIEIAERAGDHFVHGLTLLLRARVAAHMKQRDQAGADLRAAAAMIPRVADAAYRERLEADRLHVAGLLAASPAETIALLSRSIAYHSSKGRRMYLPEMLLQRGRAHLALKAHDAAAKDFEAGIVELERQRASLDAGDARWGVFGTADELFDDAVSLALDRGDESGAFAYVERARARQLLEALDDRNPVAAGLAGTSNTVLVEYASLPARLVIFVVDGSAVRTFQESISRAALHDAVESLGRSVAVRDEAQFRRLAATLHRRIVAPVAASLGDARTVVFVPDATLRPVPFAALIDADGHYLVEQHAVVVSPSAAVFTRLERRRSVPRTRRHLLVVTGPPALEGDLGVLASVQREATEVAAPYGELAVIAPKDADRAAFEVHAAAAEVVHFVGHAVTSGSGRDAALVVSRLAGAAGRLDVRNIAAMALNRTRVVVLAACNSSRGRELGGEGVVSVARAFLNAGVPSVVATLWPIEDDASADFFPRLHRHLAAGAAPAEALRAAQLESIRRRDPPLDIWAAVQVFGS
jgi:CHAT domain-containing protein